MATSLWYVMASRPWMAAGWFLLHSLWAGALGALLVGAVRWVLRSASPRLRYAVILGWLFVFFMGLVLGFLATLGGPSTRLIVPSADDLWADVGAGVVPPTVAFAALERVDVLPRLVGLGLLEPLQPLRPLVCHLPWLWFSGASLAVLRLIVVLISIGRGYRSDYTPECVRRRLQARCNRLARSMGVGRPVAVDMCARVRVPIVLGIRRPRILLPPTLISDWSNRQIEMVLLHELAHVRRGDLLANLIQRLVEAVLFFNPFARLVSRWARLERECCCDEEVVRRTGDPRLYAATLLNLTPSRTTPGAGTAFGEGQLLVRICRILDVCPPPRLCRRSLVALTALLFVTALPMGALPVISDSCLSFPDPASRTTRLAAEMEYKVNWAALLAMATALERGGPRLSLRLGRVDNIW